MNYELIQPNEELRACARRQLDGVWGKMAFTYFVYFLIYLPYNIISALNSISEWIPGIPSYFGGLNALLTIAVMVISGPFALGFAGYFLKRIRGEEIEIKNIFDGFENFFSSFLVMFFIGLFTALWSLLLLIPGIIKAYGYSMAYYIMHDDPGIKPLEAIKQSQIMMKGYKWKLFALQFSFIGWTLLCLLTLGVGFLWLNPYFNLSMANFYENLKINRKNASENMLLKDKETQMGQIF